VWQAGQIFPFENMGTSRLGCVPSLGLEWIIFDEIGGTAKVRAQNGNEGSSNGSSFAGDDARA
jgi:hypothetical protein